MPFLHPRLLHHKLLAPILGEKELHLHRLLAPQRAIVVEGRDPFVRRHIVYAAFRRHARDEIDNRRFRRAIVPGFQHL
jgi:hypothetical protein